MDWFFIALIPPIVFALSTVLDKILITKHFKGEVSVLILFSCLIGLIILPIIFFIQPNVVLINPYYAIVTILVGVFYVLYMFPYLEAMSLEEGSRVIPLFQLTPIIMGVLAFFILGETLTIQQIIAGALIIIGSIGISTKFENGAFLFKKKIVFLMVLACLLIALSRVIFKFVAIETDFWSTMFWEQVGFVLFGVIALALVPKYREQLFGFISKSKPKVAGLVAGNEILNTTGIIVSGYASLLAPISLIGVINGFQPLFVLFIWIIITIFMPKLGKEVIDKQTLAHKVFFILLLIAGAILLGASGS